MRPAIIIAGVLILAVGFVFLLGSASDSSFFIPALVVLGFGGLNLAFGIITRKGTGVSIPSKPQGIKMIVDRGVIGSAIYVMAFSESKVVLKRLASGTVTILAVVVFALVGFAISGSFVGAAVGGITAFSLQEFLTERRREAALKGDLLAPTRRGDMQFAYDDIDHIQLTRSRLRLFLKAGTLGIVISRKYPLKMRPILEQLLPKAKVEEES